MAGNSTGPVTVTITLTGQEHERLKAQKDGRTWREVLIDGAEA